MAMRYLFPRQRAVMSTADVDMGVLRALSQETGPLYKNCYTQSRKTNHLCSKMLLALWKRQEASKQVDGEEGCGSTGR